MKEKVEKNISNLSHLAKHKGIVLINNVPEEMQLYADSALLGEVIQNLASNAIKFCHRGDRVTFYQPDDRECTLAVADTGVGMSQEKIGKLFRVEEKTSTPGTAGEQGTGFGLPFSHDIIVAHGGDLFVESVEGEGSIFFVQLPIDVAETADLN